MAAFKDLTGQRFERWVVIKLDYKGHQEPCGKMKFTHWWCQCDCGTVLSVMGSNLSRGASRSCGCVRTEIITTHGLSYDPLFHVWVGIRARCTDPSHVHYDRYGGRGIQVSEEWVTNFPAFKEYVNSVLGPKPSDKHTIDREDNDGDYEAGNLRWADPFQQGSNRENNVWITLDGVTLIVAEWSRRSGIPKDTLSYRLKAGWAIDRALLSPVRSKTNKTEDKGQQ